MREGGRDNTASGSVKERRGEKKIKEGRGGKKIRRNKVEIKRENRRRRKKD